MSLKSVLGGTTREMFSPLYTRTLIPASRSWVVSTLPTQLVSATVNLIMLPVGLISLTEIWCSVVDGVEEISLSEPWVYPTAAAVAATATGDSAVAIAATAGASPGATEATAGAAAGAGAVTGAAATGNTATGDVRTFFAASAVS